MHDRWTLSLIVMQTPIARFVTVWRTACGHFIHFTSKEVVKQFQAAILNALILPSGCIRPQTTDLLVRFSVR